MNDTVELKKWDTVKIIGADCDGAEDLIGYKGQVMSVNGSRTRVYFSCSYGGYSIGGRWYLAKNLRRTK
jgi:hypothetical protein